MFRLFVTTDLLAAQGMAFCAPSMLETCVRREDGRERVKFTWQVCSCCREHREEKTCCASEGSHCCSGSSCRKESLAREGVCASRCNQCVDLAWPGMESAPGSSTAEKKIAPGPETELFFSCRLPCDRTMRPPGGVDPPGHPLNSAQRAIHLDSMVLRC